jgi:hypothetical protein
LRWLVPKPDLQLMLDAPVDVVLSRKREQSPEEIVRQGAAYRGLARGNKSCTVIDASLEAAEVTAQAVDAIVRHLEIRTRREYPDWFTAPLDSGSKEFQLCALPSAKAPRFLIALDHGRVPAHALDFYQPYKAKANLFKSLIPAVVRLAPAPVRRRWIQTVPELPFSVDQLASRVTGVSRPLLTFSIAERNTFRKMTVQITAPDGTALGFCKIPLTEAARGRVRHEAETLARLRGTDGLEAHVPEILFAGPWQDEFVLIQAPVAGRRGPERFSTSHRQFLERLWKVDPVERAGSTLIDEVRGRWRTTDGSIPSSLRALVEMAFWVAEEQLAGRTIPCGLSHGDFAPWNTRQDGTCLRVFDWEAAASAVPIWWDIFHFDSQVAGLLGEDARCGFDFDSHPAGSGVYLLYLIRSICDAAVEVPEAPRGLPYRELQIRRRLTAHRKRGSGSPGREDLNQ